MNTFVQVGLTNALVAAVLAVFAVAAGKLVRRPAFTHALWLLVLLKLVTPPIIVIPIGLPVDTKEPEPTVFAQLAPLLDPTAPQVQPSEPEPEPGVANPPADPANPPVIDKSGDTQPRKAGGKHAKKFDACVVPPAVPPPAEEPQELVPVPPSESAQLPVLQEPWWSLIPNLPWLELGGTIWLMGSVLWFAAAIARVTRFQRILDMGKAASGDLQREACELAARMGLGDCPTVWLVPGTLSPMLWAVVGYPKLLLPAGLMDRLDVTQRQALLVHELAHYRRRDHWVRCLEFVALGLYWWCPVVWWARRELREAEEECCDSWVIWTLPRATKAYADALVETLDFLSGFRPALPPVASGLGQLDFLRRRLTMIMRGKTPRNLGGLGFLAVLGLGVLLLPMMPSWAQQAPPADSEQGGQKSAQGTQDINKARAELERAMAELEQLRAHLRQLQADVELKSAKMQQFKTELKKAEQKDILMRKELTTKDQVKKKEGKDVIAAGEKKTGTMTRDQVKKLLESLDGKSRDDQIKILLKQLDKQGAVTMTTGGGAGKGTTGTFTTNPTVAKTSTITPPRPALQPVPPTPGSAPKSTAKGPAGGGDMEKRMANLEWKVDQILHEILDMRKGGAKGPAPKDKKGKGGDFEPFNAPGFPAGVIGGQGGGFGGNMMQKKGPDGPQPALGGRGLPGQGGGIGGGGGGVDIPPESRLAVPVVDPSPKKSGK